MKPYLVLYIQLGEKQGIRIGFILCASVWSWFVSGWFNGAIPKCLLIWWSSVKEWIDAYWTGSESKLSKMKNEDRTNFCVFGSFLFRYGLVHRFFGLAHKMHTPRRKKPSNDRWKYEILRFTWDSKTNLRWRLTWSHFVIGALRIVIATKKVTI